MELPALGKTIRMAMGLEPAIYRAVVQAPNGIRVAFLVVILAGFSEALGQSVVLFINNVRPKRFTLALVISALSNVIGYLLWVGVIWLIMRFFYRVDAPLGSLAAAVGLAYAPQLLAFFVLVPFLGNPFGIILSLWSMVAITVAIEAGLGLALRQAALASAAGWLLIQLWRRTLGVPIYALGRRLQRRIAGSPMRFETRDIPDLRRRFELVENMDNWRELLSRAKWEELRERMSLENLSRNFSRKATDKARDETPESRQDPAHAAPAAGEKPDRV